MVGAGAKNNAYGETDGWAYLVHVGSDEFHRLVEGVSVAGASVEDDGADGDVGQDVRVVVDEIQGVEHGFQSLDALLLLDGSAGEFQATAAESGSRASRSSAAAAAVVRQHQVLVHGKQSAKDYVARNADQVVGVLALPLRLLLLRRVVLLESEGQLAGGGRHHHEKHGGRQPQPSPGATQQFLLHGWWQRRRSCSPDVSTCPVIRFNSLSQPARPAPNH